MKLYSSQFVFPSGNDDFVIGTRGKDLIGKAHHLVGELTKFTREKDMLGNGKNHILNHQNIAVF